MDRYKRYYVLLFPLLTIWSRVHHMNLGNACKEEHCVIEPENLHQKKSWDTAHAHNQDEQMGKII